MSTRQVTCQILVCDGCRKDFQHDFTPHHDTVQDLREKSINGYEWRTDGQDLDWCPNCQVCDDEHVKDPEDSASCARCADMLDEETDQP